MMKTYAIHIYHLSSDWSFIGFVKEKLSQHSEETHFCATQKTTFAKLHLSTNSTVDRFQSCLFCAHKLINSFFLSFFLSLSPAFQEEKEWQQFVQLVVWTSCRNCAAILLLSLQAPNSKRHETFEIVTKWPVRHRRKKIMKEPRPRRNAGFAWTDRWQGTVSYFVRWFFNKLMAFHTLRWLILISTT